MFKKLQTWHFGLSTTKKILVWACATALIGSGVNAASRPQPMPTTPSAPAKIESAPPKPTIEKKVIEETSVIKFSETTLKDSRLAKDKTEIRTKGSNGVKTFTYEITYTDGKQTDKKLIKETITTAPINEVVAIGTYVAPPPAPAPSSPKPAPQATNCNANYSGCVPIASDVDCAGGSGNGPAYVQGPISVTGIDVYDLDRDGNGIGCE